MSDPGDEKVSGTEKGMITQFNGNRYPEPFMPTRAGLFALASVFPIRLECAKDWRPPLINRLHSASRASLRWTSSSVAPAASFDRSARNAMNFWLCASSATS